MTRQGLFEMADGGTLFLDELGELPLDLQPKLLRALEQREIRRVGSNKPIKVDVRIIAATNRNLEDEVRAGRFRQDLFYRLCGRARCILPPLRERVDDIPLLVQHFLDRRRRTTSSRTASQKVTRRVARGDGPAARRITWPGNVRELVNIVERAVSFAEARDRSSRAICPRRCAAKTRRRRRRAGRVPAAAESRLRAAAAPTLRARTLQGRQGALGLDVRARLHPARC